MMKEHGSNERNVKSERIVPFDVIEKEQRLYVDEGRPLVIRMDGKCVTRDHERFRLMESGENSFTKVIFDSACTYVKGMDCIVYACLDEVNMVFRYPHQITKRFEDLNGMYAAAMVLQDIREITMKSYPDVKFGIAIFNIPKGKENEYIKCRKDMGRKNAVVYAAKEFLTPDLYHGKEEEDIRRNLIAHGYGYLFGADRKWFFDGMETHIRPAAGFETVMSVLT